MNESHKKLYDVLVERGLYTKSYEEFTNQFESPESQKKMYDIVADQGLYTKTYEDFTGQFFKKKESGVSGVVGGSSQPGDFSWTLKKFVANPMLRGAMSATESAYAGVGKLEEHSRYDFGDFDADALAYEASNIMKGSSNKIAQMMNQDQEFIAGLSRIDSKKAGDKDLTSATSFSSTKSEFSPAGEYKVLTQKDIDNERDAFIKKYRDKYAVELGRSDIKEKVMEMVPEDKRNDDEFLSMLADRIYYYGGVDTDLDGNKRYNEQPLAQDMLSGLMSGTEDLVEALAYPIALIGSTEEEMKQYRSDVNKRKEIQSRMMTQNTAGIFASAQNGDVYNAFRQTMTGLSQAAPGIGVAMTGLGGAAYLGLSGGVNSYIEVADDKTFKSDGYKYGYALANAVGDFAFARIGSGIFGRAQKSAIGSYKASAEAAKAQGRAITTDMIKGYGLRKGLAFSSEFAEEAATELTTQYIAAIGRGEDVDFSEMISSAIDAGIIGGFAGTSIDYAGGVSGRARAASNARAQAQAETQRQLEERKKALEVELVGLADGNPRRRDIVLELSRINSDIESIVRGRQDFYTMLAVRYPNEFKAMQSLDYEIELLARNVNKGNMSENLKSTLEARLEDKVRQRIELQERFAGETLELDQNESSILYDMEVAEAMKALDKEISMAQESLSLISDSAGTEGADVEGIDIAKSHLEALKKKKKEALRLMGEIGMIRKSIPDTKRASQTERADMTDYEAELKKITEKESLLSNLINVEQKVISAPSRTIGSILDLNAQIANRATPEWTENNIASMKPSSLTKEQLDGIFASDNYAVLTGENPNSKALPDESNASFNKKAEEWLKKNKLKYHKVVGRYRSGENGFLVEGMTREQSAEFAREFNQESVAHKDGIVLRDGSIQMFSEGVSYDDSLNDLFSAIKDVDGNVIRFAKSTEGKFFDKDGNEITEQQFQETIKSLEGSTIDQIVNQAIEEAKSESKNTEKRQSGEVPEGSVVLGSKGGRTSVKVGDAGIVNTSEARAVNNFYKLFKSVFGNDVQIVILPDDSGYTVLSEGTGGMYINGATNTIYLSPFEVRKNAAVESEQAAEAGIKYRKKSFSETVAEEVAHAVVGPSFSKISPEQQKQIYLEALEIAKADEAMLNRLKAKKLTYEQQGKPSSEVMEEVVIDLISALSGGTASVNMSFANKVRMLYNKLVSYAYGKAGKELELSSPSQIFTVAASLDAARKSGKLFKFNVSDSSSSSQSRVVRPSALKKGDDGYVTVKVHKSLYSWKEGVKKDVGTFPQVKKFRDQWHFVNWWKKATNMGSNEDYALFETMDGETISVEDIKNYKSKERSSFVTSPSELIANDNIKRIESAESQGLISHAVAEGLKNVTSKATDAEEVSKKTVDLIKEVESITGKSLSFEGDSEYGKASQAIKLELLKRGKGVDMKKIHKALSEAYNVGDLNTAETNAILSKFISSEFGIDPSSTEEEMKDSLSNGAYALLSTYYGDESSRKRMFRGADPFDFFERNREANKLHLSHMARSGFLSDDLASEEIAYNFIKAMTSMGNPSRQNMMLASIVMYNSAAYRSANGDSYIDPSIISDIVTGLNTSGVMLRGLPGKTTKKIAEALTKFNDLVKEHQREDGTYNMQAFLERMNTVIGESSDGAKTFAAQQLLSDKIGSFALNLNGNEQAITIDSHVNKFLQKMLGTYDSAFDRFEKTRHRMARWLDIDPYGKKQRDLFDTEYEKKILSDFAGLVRNLKNKNIPKTVLPGINTKRTDQLYNSANRLLESALGVDPAVPTAFDKGELKKYRRRRIFEHAIIKGAEMMGVTPAQYTQLMFADNQIMRPGFERRASRYEEFLEASKDIMPEGQVPVWERDIDEITRYAEMLSDQDFINQMNDAEDMARSLRKGMALSELMASEPVKSTDEVRASSQLSISFNKKEDATDSDLYRVRTPEEALQIRPDLIISDRVVGEALASDATSRRIAAKKSKLADNQKVGVRLNLNVMKNTGIPVQTIHDKSAKGEALKYAAVVTVKNPTLFVDQNARKKILTFQNTKFPMASVDGEFLSDRISETSFDGVKAFFNPFKHNVFVDAKGRPIKSAGEATIVGNTVYLRGDIEYYDYNDPILKEGRTETTAQRNKRVKRGPKYEKALERFKAYSERVLGKEFADRQDLEESYDNMPIYSAVALDESDAASRAEEAQNRASSRLIMRGAAERMARKYGEIRQDIISNPENYYSKQSIAKSKDRLSIMSNQELIDMMTDDALGRLQNRNDDMSVLATAELINRAVAKGDMDAVKAYVEQAGKIGTTAGRLLRHFRELKKSSPKGLVEIIKKEVESRNRNLSQDQINKLEGLAGNLFRLQAEVEDLMKRGALGEDVDQELKDKIEELKNAERQIDTFANANIEKSWAEIGSMLIKGNLLTPISQVTNVGANLVNAVGQIGVDLVAYPVESLINIFTRSAEKARRPSFNAYMYGLRKFGSGFMEAYDEVMTGQQQDVSEWRVSRGFMPFRSLMAAVTNEGLPLTKNGEQVIIDQQRLKLFVQGTLGIPAEVMFRLLSLGDTPFRRMFEGIDLYQTGREMGLEGSDLDNFVKYPSKQQKAVAEEAGKKITFQSDTDASRVADEVTGIFERLFDKIPFVDGKWLVSTFIPYRRTPANMLMETLTFVAPPIAIARMYNAIIKGDNKEAAQNMGKAVIGGMATQTAIMLIREGLLSGPIDFGDDEEKNLAYDQFPPNSINVSGLRRLMNGGDPSKRPDDTFINYSKLGIIGAIMGSTAKANQREDLLERDYEGMSLVTNAIQDAFGLNVLAGVSHMMDQSFLQGVQGLTEVLSATEEKDLERAAENWFGSMWQATTAMVLPNTMSALYRSHREFLPDTRVTKDMDFQERIAQKMKYTVLDRTFGLNEVPVRVDWKGEPIRQTPASANSWFYQLFDITKARKAEADPVSNEIYRLYENTGRITRALGDPSFAGTAAVNIPDIDSRKEIVIAKQSGLYLPWMKDEEFSRGTIRLSTEDINRIRTIVGRNRYMELEALVSSDKYAKMSDDERVDAMDEINRKYGRAWSYEGSRLMEHTVELCRIIQEKYESERAEED
jgi:hypothetical protein